MLRCLFSFILFVFCPSIPNMVATDGHKKNVTVIMLAWHLSNHIGSIKVEVFGSQVFCVTLLL